MDPEETLRAAERALDRGDVDEAHDFLDAYHMWRARGGFEPENGDDRFESLTARTRV